MSNIKGQIGAAQCDWLMERVGLQNKGSAMNSKASPSGSELIEMNGAIDVEHLERSLAQAAPGDPAAANLVRALIEHILERYHETHRRELREAVALARKVEAVHRARVDCPHGLADLLAVMADELDGHQAKEEAVLFPMMLSGGGPMVRFPIMRMESEHVDVYRQLTRLAALTDQFTPPQGACATWRATNDGCAKLDRDLREHMRLESDVLFPHFL